MDEGVPGTQNFHCLDQVLPTQTEALVTLLQGHHQKGIVFTSTSDTPLPTPGRLPVYIHPVLIKWPVRCQEVIIKMLFGTTEMLLK